MVVPGITPGEAPGVAPVVAPLATAGDETFLLSSMDVVLIKNETAARRAGFPTSARRSRAGALPSRADIDLNLMLALN
jgi:hypothetical protein